MSINTFSSTAKLGEYFTKLPACKANGTSWVFFRDRFLFMLDAAGLGDHFDTTTTAPVAPTIVDTTAPTADEAVIKQGLALVIPDSLFLKVKGAATAKEMWEKVKEEYEKKSKMVTVDLRQKLQDERCADGVDVKTHLDKLRTMRADLIAMSTDPGDENFVAIVLGSLPASYETYLSALPGHQQQSRLETARLTGKGKKEAAFYGNGSKKPKKMMECYNCHKKGHMAKACWVKGGGKEGENPPRKGYGRVNAAKATKEFDAAWMAVSHRPEDDIEFDELDEDELGQALDDEDKDLPPPLDVSDSNDEADNEEETDEPPESPPAANPKVHENPTVTALDDPEFSAASLGAPRPWRANQRHAGKTWHREVELRHGDSSRFATKQHGPGMVGVGMCSGYMGHWGDGERWG
ncbi:hypothetical protein FB451DRAFT_1477843 [Mycena latifolia]|nr:hypothetical protein FB451DRAFT_1477843 [Mycena latifolia]